MLNQKLKHLRTTKLQVLALFQQSKPLSKLLADLINLSFRNSQGNSR